MPAVRHLANATRFHQLSGQCEDASVARWSQAVATSYFVSLGGHLFSDLLVGHEQGALCLFPLSLASMRFAERRMFPPPLGFSHLLGATFELQKSSGTFCDPGSMSQAADGRLEEEQPLKVEVIGFRRSKPLCTSQLSSPALFQ